MKGIKLLPDEWGVRIPFYIEHSRIVGSPEYNPFDPDVLLYDDLDTYNSKAERDSIKAMTQQQKSSTNLTLTNVQTLLIGKTPLFYDLALL